ncbi:MAG: hypothetical protein LUG51_12170 [Tannerellaceae bacterium]|nr:hypothetical protein [Tannerellaceae bacterium]
MDKELLHQCMKDPSRLTKETLPMLKQLIDQYPWFPVAKMLYLKNLAMLNDIHFASELRKMAIAIPDRRKLCMYIDENKYKMILPAVEKESTHALDAFSLIDSFLSAQSENRETTDESSRIIQPSVSTDYIYWAYSKGVPPEEDTAVKLKHHDLIDSFLVEDEKRIPGRGLIPGQQETVPEPTPETSPEEEHKPLDDSYFTETLARIYVKQKRYDKALQIIKNLSLKYPEKNAYFADQIRFLEKLIINTKK